eukprot:6440447-Pyramimonas_sp.AAC.1
MSRGGRPVSAVFAALPNRALVKSLSVGVNVSVAAPVAVRRFASGLRRRCMLVGGGTCNGPSWDRTQSWRKQ